MTNIINCTKVVPQSTENGEDSTIMEVQSMEIMQNIIMEMEYSGI